LATTTVAFQLVYGDELRAHNFLAEIPKNSY